MGVALLLQFLFFFTLEVFCPDLQRKGDNNDVFGDLGGLLGLLSSGNASGLFSIDNSNTVTVDAVGGDMMKTADGDAGKNGMSIDDLEGCERLRVIVDKRKKDRKRRQTETGGGTETGSTNLAAVAAVPQTGTTTNTETESTVKKEEKKEEDETPTDSTDDSNGDSEESSISDLLKDGKIVLVKKAGKNCFVVLENEEEESEDEISEEDKDSEKGKEVDKRRRRRSAFFSLVEAKDWLVQEARLFGAKFGGKNSGLCRVLGKFIH